MGALQSAIGAMGAVGLPGVHCQSAISRSKKLLAGATNGRNMSEIKRGRGRPKGVGNRKGTRDAPASPGEAGEKIKGAPATTRLFGSALRRHIAQNPVALDQAIKALFARAKQGDVRAIAEISDRLDGKPMQAVEAKVEATIHITTDDENH